MMRDGVCCAVWWGVQARGCFCLPHKQNTRESMHLRLFLSYVACSVTARHKQAGVSTKKEEERRVVVAFLP